MPPWKYLSDARLSAFAGSCCLIESFNPSSALLLTNSESISRVTSGNVSHTVSSTRLTSTSAFKLFVKNFSTKGVRRSGVRMLIVACNKPHTSSTMATTDHNPNLSVLLNQLPLRGVFSFFLAPFDSLIYYYFFDGRTVMWKQLCFDSYFT